MDSKRILDAIARYQLEIIAFLVGMTLLAFELTATRIAAPYIGSTVYVWTSVIGVILAAMAVGSAYGGVLADKRQQPLDIIRLLLATAITFIGIVLIKDGVLKAIAASGLSLQLQALTASLLLFAPPTLMLGAISPYLARLSITNLSTSGSKLSRINAAGTVGSLCGTFLTGYVLFGYIGTRYIIVLLAGILILISFLLDKKFLLKVRLALLVGLVGLWSIAPRALVQGLIHEIDTAYSRVLIRSISYAGQPVYALQTEGSGIQSAVYANGDAGLVLSYIRGFSYAAQLQPNVQRALVIGGGAFTMPTYLARTFPNAQIDTVEIDSELEQISREYFGYQLDRRLHSINEDGRTYLNQTSEKYDQIYLDAFNGLQPPFQLFTRQSVAALKNALQGEGVAAINIISPLEAGRRPLLESIYATFRAEFGTVALFPVVPTTDPGLSQNILMIASNQPIAQRAEAIAMTNEEFAAMLAAEIHLDASSGLVFDDDFAPVERMAESTRD